MPRVKIGRHVYGGPRASSSYLSNPPLVSPVVTQAMKNTEMPFLRDESMQGCGRRASYVPETHLQECAVLAGLRCARCFAGAGHSPN